MEPVRVNSSYDREFVDEVERKSGQVLSHCYQCGKCTAGCPVDFAYDIPVSQIMRLLQAGQRDRVLKSRSIWLCASCETCTARCPNDIDVARIMDTLRNIAGKEGIVAEKDIRKFWECFLDSVKKHGRIFEIGLMTAWMTRTGRLLANADLGPSVLLKGKMSFKPEDIQGREEIQKIFERYEQENA
ncbi:4Fe-4S dicluster domain-containing protein [Desulfobaculum bizertense]|uniref:Heterodisulfide reductase subunit C n=1 Tax=Desulfobaculum bizertense DSM 18034 TaxID=1121442 RepID=A0A1T4W867_9BACT|nr:4Fe-4S dicluster domain-containing protein [Desulfobaculum bizertense]UIJ39178.1 4Fe-4S dicluster domain-containing protein [Desulfobaculum bizertense]SKA73460.1 heterodisulfide reductase subunit C [Desulfobaculum bizertense DSM 18034]